MKHDDLARASSALLLQAESRRLAHERLRRHLARVSGFAAVPWRTSSVKGYQIVAAERQAAWPYLMLAAAAQRLLTSAAPPIVPRLARMLGEQRMSTARRLAWRYAGAAHAAAGVLPLER